MRNGFHVLAALVLVIGVPLGAFLYYTGEDVDEQAVRYVIVNGIAHPVPARAANDWFSELWQGKALGITVIWLSVGGSAVLFLLGRYRS